MRQSLSSDRRRRFVAARFDRKSQFGIGLTISALTLALAICALSGLLDAVLDNDILVRWDARVESWFHAHATPTGLRTFDAITKLAAPGVAVVATVVAIYLWRVRASLLLWTWLGANVGGVAIEYVLKTTVHRSRPQYAAPYLHGHSYSFPSGHTMASTICHVMLAFLVWMHPRVPPLVRGGVWAVSCVLLTAIGFSRLYLGVHYPSDVMGGLTAGLGWLAVCGATRRLLVARGGWVYGGWVRRPTAREGEAA